MHIVTLESGRDMGDAIYSFTKSNAIQHRKETLVAVPEELWRERKDWFHVASGGAVETPDGHQGWEVGVTCYANDVSENSLSDAGLCVWKRRTMIQGDRYPQYPERWTGTILFHISLLSDIDLNNTDGDVVKRFNKIHRVQSKAYDTLIYTPSN